MRAWLPVAATAIALLATPALSQVDGFGHKIPPKPEDLPPARNEGAYRDALKRIPDQKDKSDPWQTVREKPPAK